MEKSHFYVVTVVWTYRRLLFCTCVSQDSPLSNRVQLDLIQALLCGYYFPAALHNTRNTTGFAQEPDDGKDESKRGWRDVAGYACGYIFPLARIKFIIKMLLIYTFIIFMPSYTRA